MKRLLIAIIFIIASNNVFGQEWEFEEIDYSTHLDKTFQELSRLMYDNILKEAKVDTLGQISYEKIITLPGICKQDIMSYCRIFVSEYYNRADAVIEIDDSNIGVIIGKSLNHKFRIDASEEKVRIVIVHNRVQNVNQFVKENGKIRGFIHSYYNDEHKEMLLLMYAFEDCLQNKGYTEIP